MARYPTISRILQAALLEDWLLKFICVVLAVLMWIYIDGELTDQRDFVVTMRPSDVSVPAGFDLAQNRPLPKFLVRVRGPRRRLQLTSPETIFFKRKTIDSPQPGRNTINVSPSDVEAEGFDILNVSPKDEKEATVELVATANQMKPVRVKLRGEPKPNHMTGKVSVEPAQVRIEGPVYDLAQVDFVFTEEIDISNAGQDVVREVGITPYVDVNGRRIAFRSDEKVRATIEIYTVEETRRMTFNIRTMAPPGLAMSVTPATVEVDVQAQAKDLASPEVLSSIVLYVDWPSIWDKPKDGATVLGPVPVQVKAIVPPRVQIKPVQGADLPTVQVTGSLAPATIKTPK